MKDKVGKILLKFNTFFPTLSGWTPHHLVRGNHPKRRARGLPLASWPLGAHFMGKRQEPRQGTRVNRKKT